MTLRTSAKESSYAYRRDNDTCNKRQGCSYFTMTHFQAPSY